jgi:hypothetical protein
MADETTTQEQNLDTTAPTVEVNGSISDLLSDMMLGEKVDLSKYQKQEETTVPQPAPTSADAATTTPAPTDAEEIFDENDYIKKKYGYDSAELFENEIKALKEKSAQVFEWKDDNSKKIAELINEGKLDDLYNHLHTQKQLEKLSTADLNANKNLAAELVKFGIKNDNKDSNLSDDEVEFLFNQTYAMPEKPVQGDVETDEEFQARTNAWQQQVNNIERKLVIEAKIQQPKLAQLKTELVLPKIQRENEQPKPSQKDLDDFKKLQDSFLQSATKSINDFNGFSVQVKDKDVDYTTGYTPSQEEKTFINQKIQKFAESGFNANALFAEDWIEADGKTINVNKMTEDLSRIYFGKNADSKIAIDSGNKRLEAYLKEKKQVNVTQQPQGTFAPQNPQSKEDRILDAWLRV